MQASPGSMAPAGWPRLPPARLDPMRRSRKPLETPVILPRAGEQLARARAVSPRARAVSLRARAVSPRERSIAPFGNVRGKSSGSHQMCNGAKPGVICDY
jgi:hypothetical protein